MLLGDLGERKITEEILPTICPAAGDDCCYFNVGDFDLVVTTDPVPPPAALVIGGDRDLYWAGRLLVTINASDLAAAGAEPLVFVAAAEFPADTKVEDFQQLLRGIHDACGLEGLEYSGGNLKEAKSFAATGTAIGRVPTNKGLHRKGARAGDVLFSVGRGGEFWRDALRWRNGERFPKGDSKLFAPISELRSMGILAREVRIACAMDNSDGLLSTLEQLSRLNSLAIELEVERLAVPDTALSTFDQARLWMGWGDWNVVLAVFPAHVEKIESVSRSHGIDLFRIGQFAAGSPEVRLVADGRSVRAPRFESERFAKDSWFSDGIDGYISKLQSLNVHTQ
jgi:thiamine-monophosphate kinase